jgi:hypothetical protein
MIEGYQPKIIGFLCNWCSYAGADLAGTSRISYPANIMWRVITIPVVALPYFILSWNIWASKRSDSVWNGSPPLRARNFLSWSPLSPKS